MHNQYAVVLRFRKAVRKMLAVCLVLCLNGMAAFPRDKADVVPPGNWAAIESLEKGASVSMRMTSGDRIDGKFLGLDTAGIVLATGSQERIFPRSGVAEIWRLRAGDSKLNGTLYGLLAGAAGGGIAAGTMGQLFSNEGKEGWGALFVAAGIGIGALTGFAVDAAIKGNKLLYRK